MIERIYQIVMFIISSLCFALCFGVFIQFCHTLGILPDTGNERSDMIYLFAGAGLGLISGIAASIYIIRKYNYYVPHFILFCLFSTVVFILSVASLSRTFNLAA